MHKQIIENQEHFFRRILDRHFQELDELARVNGLINNHPARFTLIGYRRNHQWLVWRVPPTANVTGVLPIGA